MRKISLTLALVLILTLALPGCGKTPDTPDYATEGYALASPYLACIGKTRGETIAAAGITQEEYFMGPPEEVDHRISRIQPVSIDGVDFRLTLQFGANYDAPDGQSREGLEMDADGDRLQSFFYVCELDSNKTKYGREALQTAYDFLVSEHGEPDTVEQGREPMTIQYVLDNDGLVPGNTYVQEWLLSKNPLYFSEVPSMFSDKGAEHYLLIRLEAEVMAFVTTVTIRYTVYDSLASWLDYDKVS